VVACLALSESQARLWKDNKTLFTHTLAVTTNNFVAHLDLGNALVEEGKLREAEAQYAESAAINPRYPDAQCNWGTALALQGKYDEAIGHFQAALALKPEADETHFLLGCALAQQGHIAEAINEYKASLLINPDLPQALNNLTWVFATDPEPQLRNGAEAVRLGERLCRVTDFREPLFLGTLAAAYAEAGRFEEAARTAEKAKKLAAAAGKSDLVEKNRELLESYRACQPYREKPGKHDPQP
jgi:tetratricopeptide (TPR) repeat protein